MKLRAALILPALASLALVAPGFAAAGRAQQNQDLGSFSPPKMSARNRVEVLSPRPVRVTPGNKATVDLQFRVDPGFHINSNRPGSDLLIPTEVKLDPPTNVFVGDVQYPAGREFSLSAAPGEKLNVYTGDFAVKALVTAARNISPGRYRVHGFLEYQACDDRACYPPAKLPVAFDVRVTRAARRHHRNPGQSPDIHN